jgi:hypothetical protein
MMTYLLFVHANKVNVLAMRNISPVSAARHSNIQLNINKLFLDNENADKKCLSLNQRPSREAKTFSASKQVSDTLWDTDKFSPDPPILFLIQFNIIYLNADS